MVPLSDEDPFRICPPPGYQVIVLAIAMAPFPSPFTEFCLNNVHLIQNADHRLLLEAAEHPIFLEWSLQTLPASAPGNRSPVCGFNVDDLNPAESNVGGFV